MSQVQLQRKARDWWDKAVKELNTERLRNNEV